MASYKLQVTSCKWGLGRREERPAGMPAVRMVRGVRVVFRGFSAMMRDDSRELDGRGNDLWPISLYTIVML